MEKYTIGGIQPTRTRCFEVIIVGDSNDADYISTREFFSEEDFDNHVVDELIELLNKYDGSHELKGFSNQWLDIPSSDWGCCHSLEEVEVNYYDNNGSVRPVKINSGFYTVCHKCDWDLEDCICGGKK